MMEFCEIKRIFFLAEIHNFFDEQNVDEMLIASLHKAIRRSWIIGENNDFFMMLSFGSLNLSYFDR